MNNIPIPNGLGKSRSAKTKLEYEVYRHVLTPKRMPFAKPEKQK